MKPPEDCENLPDVREAIDVLDREIVNLIGRRARYVRVAANFKTSEAGVRAPDRQSKMLQERRRWAEEEGLDPDTIEKIYRDLVTYFVNREVEDWKQTSR
ncbi:MAG: isochorismate lyase [Rubrobacteraceae bacterium]